MGDRASAAESGMALGAVAQGLSTHQNAIMQLYADIARQCIANRVAYSPRQEFPVSNYGDNSSISIQEMALDAIVNVKPALAKKVQEKTLAANAMQIIGTLGPQLNEEGLAYLMEQAMMGTMPRKVAENFIREKGPSEQEMALAQQQAQNDAQILQQNQQMYEQNPTQYETDNVLATQDPDSIDAIIAGLGQGQEAAVDFDDVSSDMTFSPGGPESLDMMSQEGAMTTGGVQGMTPESGGAYANPNGLIG